MERSLIQLPFLVVIIIVGVTPTIILPSFSSSPLSDLKSNLGNNNSDDDNGEDDSDNGNGNDGDSERAVPSESRNTDNDNEEGAGGLIEQQQWLTYENSKYGIKVQYPSGWNLKEGDRFPGDYETDIVRFYPPDVGDFSEDEFSDKERPSVVLKLSIYSLTPIEGDIDLDTYLDDVIN